MNRTIFLTGVVLGTLAIIFGAFGAHGLEKLVDSHAIQTYGTGVRYQMYQSLFLMILGSMKSIPTEHKKWVFYLIVMGTLSFSGSIYLLATNALTSFDFKSIGFLTPIGGAFQIFGWLLLGYRTFKHFD